MPSWYPQRQVNYQNLLSDPIIIFLLHRNPFTDRYIKADVHKIAFPLRPRLHLPMLYSNNNERTENKALNMAHTDAGLGIVTKR
jgi:hypothetical protein